jgi:hypothetical protein
VFEPPFSIGPATLVNIPITDLVTSRPPQSCELLIADITGQPAGAYLDFARYLLTTNGCFVRLCHRRNNVVVTSAQLREAMTPTIDVGCTVRTHTRGQRLPDSRGVIQPAYLDRVLREEAGGRSTVIALTSCGGMLPAAAKRCGQPLVCTEPDRGAFLCATVNFARSLNFPFEGEPATAATLVASDY